MDIFKGIRPLDYVLTAVMVTLAVLIGLENVGASADVAHDLDSQSALMLPVFAIATLPILWRRRNILAVIGVSLVITAATLPMFGWVTRCGWAVPLSMAMAYAVARFAGSRQNRVVGLVGILALQVVAMVMDSATGGLGGLVVSLPAAALCYGIGLFVQSRTEKPTTTDPREHVAQRPLGASS
jgi:hypothetical protein